MMASYIGAVVLVMGYLITASIVGQKIEYRETFALWEPLGNGAIGEVDPLLDAERDEQPPHRRSKGVLLFNRLIAIGLGAIAFLGFTLWRFSTDRARAVEAQAPQAGQARRQREAKARRRPAVLGGEAIVARDARPSRWAQFMTRLRVEVRQVLTSPGLIVLALLADRLYRRVPVARPVDLRHRQTIRRSTATIEHGARRLGDFPVDDRRLLRRRAGVARARPQAQRDHRFHARCRAG